MKHWQEHTQRINCPLENWRRPLERPRTNWIKTIQQDLKPNDLSMNEANDVDSESSTLETDIYVWRYALLVVHARNNDDDECIQFVIYITQQTLISSQTSSSTTVACTTCCIGTMRQWPSFIDWWRGTIRLTCTTTSQTTLKHSGQNFTKVTWWPHIYTVLSLPFGLLKPTAIS